MPFFNTNRYLSVLVFNSLKNRVISINWFAVRFQSKGNQNNGNVKIPGNSNDIHDDDNRNLNRIPRTRLRRQLSPADRLAENLPTEYQATGLQGDTCKHDQNQYLTDDSNENTPNKYGDDLPVDDENKSLFNVKCKPTNPGKSEGFASHSVDAEGKRDSVRLQNELVEKGIKFSRRKRSLSPLQRFSEQIPKDFWSDENKDMKSTIDTLKDADSKTQKGNKA